MIATSALAALSFELERGGDGEAGDEGATVWLCDAAALNAAALAQRFVDDWAAWYGPALAPHAAAIASLLHFEARQNEPEAGQVQLMRDGRHAVVRLPGAWALPVIRRRERGLRIGGWSPDDPHDWLDAGWQALPAAWRRSRGGRVQLALRMRMYWGALAEPAPGPGGVSWRRCRVRADALAVTPWAWTVERGRALAVTGEGGSVERRLRGGIGLMLIQPLLRIERPQPPAGSRLRAGGQALLHRFAGAAASRAPAFCARIAADEAFWSAALPDGAGDAATLAAAARRGAWLRPASRAALRHGRGTIEREHVVLLPDSPGGVRSSFSAALAASPAPEAALWPGLPALDTLAAWRFELDGGRPLDHQLETLANALDARIVAPTGPLAKGSRIVFVGHGTGGCLARFALEALRQRWARRGWRVEALTLGSPHLGSGAAAFGPEVWPTPALPPGQSDLLPDAVQARAGGDATRLPAGMWLFGAVWGPPAVDDADVPGRVIDDLQQPPASGDGRFTRHSTLAGRTPRAPGERPPDDGTVVIDASPVLHDRYLASPGVRRQVQRALDHLLGREGSWA
ncbi:hypothetical protein HLB44_13945 [Aquincola sp. S2]|uniref:Uncharacterized protein n=1 Tax=Pseudaquabacterium terrae TaxID=2732868 RepID=A0ABX2EHI7_9BURK|nr:hypothetical protein [Aquabacterium terrae]NRF68090.1 hypothetical protein [Aquabacterium terrae]